MKKLHCEKHGDYEQREIPLFGNKTLIIDTCPTCAAELKKSEQAEAAERKQREDVLKYQRRKEQAGISPRNFNVKFGPNHFSIQNDKQKQAYDVVHKFAKSVYKGEQQSSLIMIGKVGTGKTLLANCTANALVKSHNIRIVKLIEMIREIKETWSNNSNRTESEVIDYYCKLDLLIIDEAGIGFNSDTEKMFIFDIIDGRYQNMKPNMVISNLNLEDLSEALGQRVIDRLREGGGQKVVLDWESYRK